MHALIQKASGDFPTVLYEVVSKRSSVVEGSLSIDDVNEILDEISQNMGKRLYILRTPPVTTTDNARTARFSLAFCSECTIARLQRSSDGSSVSFLKARFPTQRRLHFDSLILDWPTDMVISVKETTVFSVFHPDAHDLFNTCSDLKKVAWGLWDPKRRLNEDVSSNLHDAS